MTGATGKLIGIALRSKIHAPMETRESGHISIESGLEGDARGAKFPRRQITILAVEDWRNAINDLIDLMGPPDLDWTVRRANLLVEGLRLPRAKGARLAIGPVILEVTGQTYPCSRMEQAHKGLLSALAPDWRGGVTCRVISGGPVALSDRIGLLSSPPEHKISLPF